MQNAPPRRLRVPPIVSSSCACVFTLWQSAEGQDQIGAGVEEENEPRREPLSPPRDQTMPGALHTSQSRGTLYLWEEPYFCRCIHQYIGQLWVYISTDSHSKLGV